MKAVVQTKYGLPDVLEFRTEEKPVTKDNEILIKVLAASVNPLDWHSLLGKPYIIRAETGFGKPKNPRLGLDLAGQVEAVGRNVTQFRPGDAVFGVRRGSFAEYVCTQGKVLALKPASLTFEQAAAVPVAGFTALQGLRNQGRLQASQKVLINGAAGGVGTFSVQIAKAIGAEVTAVCSSRNVDMVQSLGADHVIDYTRENFTRGGRRYDLLFDAVGNHSLSACRRVLEPTGTYVAVAGSPGHLLTLMIMSRLVSHKLVFFVSRANQEDLVFLRELIEAKKVTPVIDRCYALSEVPEALRYLGEGHARGKVVISLKNGQGL